MGIMKNHIAQTAALRWGGDGWFAAASSAFLQDGAGQDKEGAQV